MNSSIEKSIADLVTELPERAAIFDKYGIDFCCGGSRTLSQACIDADVRLDDVLGEINIIKENSEFASISSESSLAEIIDHILSLHHSYLDRELPRLQTLCGKVSRVHGERRPELVMLEKVYSSFKEELEEHCRKEETVLFPVLRRFESQPQNLGADAYRLLSPVRDLETEHEQAAQFLEKIRCLTSNYTLPEDACRSYRLLYEGLSALDFDLRMHVHKENNILFPKLRSHLCELIAL